MVRLHFQNSIWPIASGHTAYVVVNKFFAFSCCSWKNWRVKRFHVPRILFAGVVYGIQGRELALGGQGHLQFKRKACMKLTVLLLLLGLTVNSYTQNQVSNGASSSVTPNNSALVEVSPYTITERGPHHHVWQRVMVQTNSIGTPVYQTNSYTELATGMCFWNGNQWVDASDQIQLTANGATATTTQHHVGLAPNINSAGAINLTTPDNQQMTSQVLGLAYLDGDTGSNVLFAGIQDSIGQLLPSGNQVIYTNAFANAEADVLYSQKLSGMEQDVVLRQQLPSASTY